MKLLPKLKEDRGMNRSDFDFRTTDQGIGYYKWKDDKCVHFLSNYHGSETTTLSHRERDGTRNDVMAPTVVSDYNLSIDGVVEVDMFCSIHDRN